MPALNTGQTCEALSSGCPSCPHPPRCMLCCMPCQLQPAYCMICILSYQYAAAVYMQLLPVLQSAALKFLQDQSRTEVRAVAWQHAALHVERECAAAARKVSQQYIWLSWQWHSIPHQLLW